MPSATRNRKRKTEQPSSLKDNIFKAAARMLKTRKLGDLLIGSDIISPAQLNAALTEQKKTGAPLGRILIRQGAVSSLQLYRKLARQWCLKTSAAGIALILQATAPSATYASAVVPPSLAGQFNTQAIKSNDISAFKKWTGMMARFEEQTKSVSATSPRVMLWKVEIQRLQNKPRRLQIESINAFFNKLRYIEDKDNYGKRDYWATPLEFLSRGGDCEDFAIAKYASLRALGFAPEQLRIAIVQDQVKNIPHAVLIVYADDDAVILDNQDGKVEPASSVTRYKPIFAINSTSWWLYEA